MTQALQGQAVSNAQEVTRRDLPFEFMMNALRLREGFALDGFMQRTGLPLSAVKGALQTAQAQGLLLWNEASDLVAPTERGYDFLSNLQALFLPPGSKLSGSDTTVQAISLDGLKKPRA
jgi:oxygen-independent coproporphyrinogen-3 oxidase